MIDLREKIKTEMLRQGITIYALAKHSGIAYQTLSNYINGRGDTTTEKFARLLDVLNMQVTSSE